MQIGQRVVVGGVQLEGQADERSALGVEAHDAHLAPVDESTCVEVAKRCLAGGAAVARLVLHLGADVVAADLHLELVEHGHDGLHCLAHVPLAEVLLG
nr:hypothetical protein [Nocardiopsis sp. NRRL B-16309]